MPVLFPPPSLERPPLYYQHIITSPSLPSPFFMNVGGNLSEGGRSFSPQSRCHPLPFFFLLGEDVPSLFLAFGYFSSSAEFSTIGFSAFLIM